MRKPRLRHATSEIVSALLALSIWGSGVLEPGAALAADRQEPNRPDISVRMLHVFVKADVNDVRLENIWVLERADVNSPWLARMELPRGAELLEVDEPNLTSYIPDSAAVVKPMAADSKVGSVGFAYLLPNEAGKCRITIRLAYRVDSMVLSVSGKNTQVESDRLEFDSFRASRSVFSSVYAADDLPASTEVMISLSNLPTEDSSWIRSITLVILVLIFGLAAITIHFCWNRDKGD